MKKIAFFRMGSFSYVNSQVIQQLKVNFPQYNIQDINIWDHFVHRKDILNLIHTLMEFGLWSLGNIPFGLIRTNYLYHLLKKRVIEFLSKGDYIFSFQTQSLFDLSHPNIPHFIYTDNTRLANMEYLTEKAKTFMEIIKETYFKNKKFLSLLKTETAKTITLKIVDNPLKFEMEKHIYQNAFRVFTMSSNVSDSLTKHYNISLDKVKCIYAGPNAFLTEAQNHLSRYQRKNILFVGKDWERKGGPVLLEAFKTISQKHPDATLTIVGAKPKVDKIPQCKFEGMCSFEKVDRLYKNASIFCMPTQIEPFGNVFIEALVNMLPIVATNIAAVPDLVIPGHNGYLVERNNPTEVAIALDRLLSDPVTCQTFGKRGYEIANERYSWKNTGELLKKYINECIFDPKNSDLNASRFHANDKGKSDFCMV